MPRRPDVPCADCGRLMWAGTGSLPVGQARCRPCRKANPIHTHQANGTKAPLKVCIDCSTSCWGMRCRSCATKAKVSAPKMIRSLDDYRVMRRQREQAAPGLSTHARSKLLHRWKRQGARCAYCLDRAATTIDHVLPLVRGGTNHEGNLTPACRSCNGSKGGLTVAEWRTGRRLPRMVSSLGWSIAVAQPKVSKPRSWADPLPMFNVCAGCGDVAGNRAEFCSARCGARTAYRRKVGIPDSVEPYSTRASVFEGGTTATSATAFRVSPQQIVGAQSA